MTTQLYNADILAWADTYEGQPFHALISDPPYNLESISKRFGKAGSAPAKFGKDGSFSRLSSGFMNQDWDNDIAFQPETWDKIKRLLYPGAFGLAFSSTRTYHRLAMALEDAGFIIHPMFGWIQSQGFPKATNLSKNLDKRAGATREVIGKNKNHRGQSQMTNPYTKGLGQNGDLTSPNTELAKIWDGYFYGLQALAPSLEPICLFQKPYDGDTINSITTTGAGALNIKDTIYLNPKGHVINRFSSGMKPFGNGVDEEYVSTTSDEYFPKNLLTWDGLELDDDEKSDFYIRLKNYKYNAKVSKREKDFGLDGFEDVVVNDGRTTPIDNPFQRGQTIRKNHHPTVKPIELIAYLSNLLLPPGEYQPRRILVPFSGSGSEVIGASLAGWDEVVGVELKEEYCSLALERINAWLN